MPCWQSRTSPEMESKVHFNKTFFFLCFCWLRLGQASCWWKDKDTWDCFENKMLEFPTTRCVHYAWGLTWLRLSAVMSQAFGHDNTRVFSTRKGNLFVSANSRGVLCQLDLTSPWLCGILIWRVAHRVPVGLQIGKELVTNSTKTADFKIAY